METPHLSAVYKVRITRTITSEATIKVTAPHSDSALFAAEDSEAMQPHFRTTSKRITYIVIPPKGGNKL